MKLFKDTTTFKFVSKGKYAFIISALFLAASVYIWIDRGATKYGIDYAGGYELVVKANGAEVTSKLRSLLKEEGIQEAMVQSFESGSNEYAVRIPVDAQATDAGAKEATNEVKAAVQAALTKGFGSDATIEGTDYVGPTISEELKEKAITAVIVGLLGILAYITMRFEFSFALGAVAALFHDVIVCMGVYLFTGRSLTMATLAASLTIVGYSVNDTIIVFDRIREELFKQRKLSVEEVMDFSINATLSRTVITSLLTLFSAVALLLFGGGAISDLALFLVVGVIAGTYSTIFIASPVALAWERSRVRADERKEKKAAKASSTAMSTVL